MAKRQAQNVAAAIWGRCAIGVVCRLVEVRTGEYQVIGDATLGQVGGSIAIAANVVKLKFDALWHQWSGDDADEYWWATDADDYRHERSAEASELREEMDE